MALGIDRRRESTSRERSDMPDNGAKQPRGRGAFSSPATRVAGPIPRVSGPLSHCVTYQHSAGGRCALQTRTTRSSIAIGGTTVQLEGAVS